MVEDGDSLLEGGRKGGRIRSLDITGLVSISRGKDSGQGRPLLLVWSEERKGEEERERERERRIGRGVSGREKIKQIGMQRTTTGGWNEGGVKLGQLGVAAPRGWDQYSLFLSSALAPTIATAHRDTRTFLRFSPLFSFLHTHTHIYLYIYIHTCFPFSSMVRYARLAANPSPRGRRNERKDESSSLRGERVTRRERERERSPSPRIRWIADCRGMESG